MIPPGLEIATPGKWSTSKIVKNFTGAKLCLLQSLFHSSGCGQPFSLYSVWTVNINKVCSFGSLVKIASLKLTYMLTACCAKDGKVSLSVYSSVCHKICFS